MEKNKGVPSIRRYAATATMLAVVLILMLINGIAKYADDVADLVDEPRTDLDNLFIYMMNESLPVGSIYMSTDIRYAMASDAPSGAKSMESVFGGEWEAWGQGRVPVGVNVDGTSNVVAESNPDRPGGSLPIPRSLSLPLNFARTDGTIALDNGVPVNYTETGTTLTSTGVTLSGSQTFASDNVTLSSSNLPQHSHTASLSLTYKQHNNGGQCLSDDRYHININGSSTNKPKGWSLSISYAGQASPSSFSLGTIISTAAGTTNRVTITGTPTMPKVSYSLNNPAAIHTKQEITAASIASLGATGINSTIYYSDNTIQPYQTCYMYKRKTLALLAPLS